MGSRSIRRWYFYSIWLFILCHLPFFLLGQKEVSLNLGAEYQNKGWDFPSTVVGSDNTGYYIYHSTPDLYKGSAMTRFRFSKQRIYLRKFDRSLNPKIEVELELNADGKAEIPHDAFYRNSHIYLFSTFDDRRARKKSLYIREIGTKTLKVPAKGRELCEVSYESYPRNTYIDFDVHQSRDTSKVLVVYAKPGSKKDQLVYGAILFNDEMIKLWEQEFVLPYEKELFDTKKFRVGNDGSVYLLGKQYFDKFKDRVKGEPNYNFKLLSLQPGFEVPEEFTLEVPGLFLIDTHLEILPDGNLVCAGAYTEKNMRNPKGIFYLTLGRDNWKVISESRQELSLDMFREEEENKTSKRKEKKNADKAFYNYEFRDMLLRDGGGAVLIGETTYKSTLTEFSRNSSTGPGPSTTIYYHHNDIIVIDINHSGQIKAAHRIPKRQRLERANLMLSFGLAVSEDALLFIHNDDIKNDRIMPGEKPTLYNPSMFEKSKQVVRAVSLNRAGKINSTRLATLKESNQYAIPLASKQTSPSELILIFQGGKKRRLGRITFE